MTAQESTDARGRVRMGVLSMEHVHAGSYVPLLAEIPGASLVGIWDADRAHAESAASSVGARAFASVAELLGQVDAVVVTAPNAEHRELVEQAAAAGVDVLCEKPLATSVADARAIVEACNGAGVRLMTAFPSRWNPALRSLRTTIVAGGLGEVVALEGVNTGAMPDIHAGWFVDPARSGGGAITDHVVHLADLYRWMLGSEVVEVYAVANRILQERFERVETGGLVSLRFANGAFATIDCSWSRPRSYPTWGGLSIAAIGTGGAITVDAFSQRLHLYGTREAGVSWPDWGPNSDRAMLEAFVDAVRERREPAVTGIDGLRAVEIVDAAYRSIEAGEPVRVEVTGIVSGSAETLAELR